MANEYTRLDSQFSLMGAFWLPEIPERVQSGMLTSDERQIVFSTSPDYSRGIKVEDISDLLSFRLGTKFSVMHGYVEDFPCTLCEVMEIDRPGITDFQHGQSLSAKSYRAALCVSRMHLGGIDDRCLTSARYTFTALNEWLPSTVIENWNEEAIVLTLPAVAREFASFSIPANRVSVCIRLHSELQNAEEAGRVARSIPEIEVRSPEPESLSWYLDAGNRLENLFSVLIGSSLAIRTIFIHRGDEGGTVIMKKHSNPQAFDLLTCVRCTASQAAQSIATWLSEPPGFRSVENVALGVLRRGKLFIETEFLSLAQSLEGFHRATTKPPRIDKSSLRRVRKQVSDLLQGEGIELALQQRICMGMMQAIDPTFKVRLTELCQQLSPILLMRMGIQLPDFIDDVANSRNFYTHTGKSDLEVRKKPALTGKQLFLLNQKLRALLRAVLLLHIGVPEAQFSEVIARTAMQWL